MAAVATTLLGVPASELETFLRWHLRIGFDLVFLFFDCTCDCAEEQGAIEAAQKPEFASRVIVTFSDEELRNQQRRFNGRWRSLQPFLHQVPARQELNVESALTMSAARGMRWLLHLDADELFLPSAGARWEGKQELATENGRKLFSVENAVRDHFAALDEAGVGHVTYKNVEAVAEEEEEEEEEAVIAEVLREEEAVIAAGDCEPKPKNSKKTKERNVFESVSLFREHFSDIPLTSAAQGCMREWMDRSPVGQYFLAYDNGKSAVRVLPRSSPRGVHSFILPHETMPGPSEHASEGAGEEQGSTQSHPLGEEEEQGQEWPRRPLKRVSYIRDFRSNRASTAGRTPPLPVDACLLHYVSCSYEQWYDKYRKLGQFQTDSWLGGKVKLQRCFHTDSQAVVAKGDECKARDWYNIHVLVPQPLIQRSIQQGICKKITHVIDALFPQKSLLTHTSSSSHPAGRIKKNPPSDLRLCKHSTRPSNQLSGAGRAANGANGGEGIDGEAGHTSIGEGGGGVIQVGGEEGGGYCRLYRKGAVANESARENVAPLCDFKQNCMTRIA